ncbi:MAG: S-layer homology domain-containing protein [Oscillospiraceae bacterium]|nr:S-layer homology domain-containing protein [Oscillospiraceae bacterium]
MKRLLSFLLVLVLLASTLQVFAAGDAMSDESLKELLNSVELKPQRSGYPEVDALMEEILAPHAHEDNYTRLRALYDWVTTQVAYSWAPYSQDWAPAYDCFVPLYDLDYETGLEEAIPFEVVNRSYHALVKREGICYDYGALFALMARYMGFESYVHTGEFYFEPEFNNITGHHGWAEIEIDGKYYIFDPQRDYRLCGNATQPNRFLYFGIDEDHDWRYTHEKAVNDARDAGFLSVHAPRHAELKVESTISGFAFGEGTYVLGEQVTVNAEGIKYFQGWFDEKGKLVSEDVSYTFAMERSMTLRAVFEDEYFDDIADQWYEADAVSAYDMGLVDGVSPFTFYGKGSMTRAMALTVLYRMAAPEDKADSASYTDVLPGSWYEEAVNWGTQMGVVNGVGEGRFNPNGTVTREQFITMMMRLCGGENIPELALSYEDADTISDYAYSAFQQAQVFGLLTGYEDHTIRPQKELSRAEAVALLMRLARWLETE